MSAVRRLILTVTIIPLHVRDPRLIEMSIGDDADTPTIDGGTFGELVEWVASEERVSPVAYRSHCGRIGDRELADFSEEYEEARNVDDVHRTVIARVCDVDWNPKWPGLGMDPYDGVSARREVHLPYILHSCSSVSE